MRTFGINMVDAKLPLPPLREVNIFKVEANVKNQKDHSPDASPSEKVDYELIYGPGCMLWNADTLTRASRIRVDRCLVLMVKSRLS